MVNTLNREILSKIVEFSLKAVQRADIRRAAQSREQSREDSRQSSTADRQHNKYYMVYLLTIHGKKVFCSGVVLFQFK